MYNQASIYKGGGVYKMGEASSLPDNFEKPKRLAVVGDAVYSDANGNVHILVSSTINMSTLPSGWEFVGVVALREGTKAIILHKNESNSIKFANCWLFKVDGLTFPLASSVSMVMQQGPASGSSPVEVGTYTSSEGVATLDEFVDDLDDWLQDHPTAEGAFSNYGWHAAKMKDAGGNDACFIIVDNISSQSLFSPVKSGDATSPLYMFDFAGFTSNEQTILRKDGVNTYAVVWNKERFKTNNTNVNSPTDSLTTAGLFNEAGFNATTTVKAHYGTYDNYLDHMGPDTDATTGAYAVFKGLGKQTADRLNAVKYTPLNGTEQAVFGAEAYAAGQKAHSTASVEGLNTGDWYIPCIDVIYNILSIMKEDGSDIINSSRVLAGSLALSLSNSRWTIGRFNDNTDWRTNTNGSFSINSLYGNGNKTICVASYDVGE